MFEFCNIELSCNSCEPIQNMRVVVNQRTCPIRYMFIIQPDNEGRFLRAIQTACSIWGGIFSPIFPFYTELPQEFRQEYQVFLETTAFYHNTLLNYDPDVILYDEDLDINFLKVLAKDRELLPINEFISKVINGRCDWAITTLEICEYILGDLFKYQRTDGLKIRIPQIDNADLFLKAICGSALPDIEQVITTSLREHPAFESSELTWNNLSNYRNSDRVDVKDMCCYEIHSWSTNRISRNYECVYLLEATRLRDIINFWNLRAAGWTVIPLALDKLQTSYFKEIFDDFMGFLLARSNDNVVSFTFLNHRNFADDLVKAAKVSIGFNPAGYNVAVSSGTKSWFPRFWEQPEICQADHIQSHQPYYNTSVGQYVMEARTIEIPIKNIPFESKSNRSRRTAFKILLEPYPANEELEYATVLGGIGNKQLRSMIGFFPSNDFRLGSLGIYAFTRSDSEKLDIDMPLSTDLFRCYFSNIGYKLQATSNGRLAKEVLRNIGGLIGSRRFLTPAKLRIVESFEGGKVVNYATLVSEIKRATKLNNNSHVKNFISMLLSNKIIEMGAEIQCAVCDQRGFYLPAHLAETITCPVCRNQFPLPAASPTTIAWAYRGIGPFSRNNKADGVMAVFATAALVKEEFAGIHRQMSVLFGFELVENATPDKKKEVDLCVLLKNSNDDSLPPDLLLCECKTYKHFEAVDIQRMKILGDAFPGAVVVIATLNDQLTAAETALIVDLVQYLQKGLGPRPQNPVLILTGNELLPENIHDAFEAYKDQIRVHQRFNDFIGAISDLTIRKHLQIDTWSEIMTNRHMDEMQKRKTIGLVVANLLRYHGLS